MCNNAVPLRRDTAVDGANHSAPSNREQSKAQPAIRTCSASRVLDEYVILTTSSRLWKDPREASPGHPDYLIKSRGVPSNSEGDIDAQEYVQPIGLADSEPSRSAMVNEHSPVNRGSG